MNIPNLKKPFDPRFSCGPTKKPEGWSLEKFNEFFWDDIIGLMM